MNGRSMQPEHRINDVRHFFRKQHDRRKWTRWNVRSYLAVMDAALCGRFAIETLVVEYFELVRLRQSVVPIQACEEVGHRK